MHNKLQKPETACAFQLNILIAFIHCYGNVSLVINGKIHYMKLKGFGVVNVLILKTESTHTWKARPYHILEGNWCHQCYLIERGSIKEPSNTGNPGKKKFDISKDDLQRLVWEMPTEQVALKFGVSGKAIEKRCKRLGIEKP